MKFRKKPVVIEAAQFTIIGRDARASAWAIMEWAKYSEPSVTLTLHHDFNGTPTLIVPTLEGTMHAEVGDWIIRGVKGEFYPCKPDIFDATYELESAPRSGVTHDDGAGQGHMVVHGRIRERVAADADGRCVDAVDHHLGETRGGVGPVRVPGLDLEAIEARERAATKGPWTNGMRGRGSTGDAHMCRIIARRTAGTDGRMAAYGEVIGMTWHPEHGVSYVGFSRQQNVDNAEFIAHAREDIPALLAELRRLHAGAPAEPSDVEGEPAPIIPGRNPRPATIIVGAPAEKEPVISRTSSGAPE